MLATALVVMGSSADIFDSRCPIIETAVFCRRTKFAISLGAIGTFISLIVVALKLLTSTNQAFIEGLLALFLAVLNGFGVAFITSAKGPGSAIGNLYVIVRTLRTVLCIPHSLVGRQCVCFRQVLLHMAFLFMLVHAYGKLP